MNDDKSRVSELNDSLYSKTRYHDPNDSRSGMRTRETDNVDESFDSPKLDEMIARERRKSENHPIMKKFFTFAIFFFLATMAVAGYIYLAGNNLISSKNVDINIVAPVTVSAGEPLELGVTIINKNNADLAVVNMVIQYPDGTRSDVDTSRPLTRSKLALGEIKAGASITKTDRAILFGEKGDVKSIKISIDYKVKGSNAIFTKEKIYEISIGTTPVTMTVDEPPTVASGDKFTTTLTILANSSEILKNVIIRAEYPYGYGVISSSPGPVTGDNVWLLGDLAPGDKKTIVIKGSLSGENAEERTFRFYAGVASPDNPNTFDSPLSTISQTIGISRSSLGLVMTLNGDDAAVYAAPIGKQIQASIKYKNNLPEAIINGRIQVKITGGALDQLSIIPQNGGFYDSANSVIVWDTANSPGLGTVLPGDEGQFGFTFSSLSNLTQSAKNSEIILSTNFTASPQSTDNTANLSATTVHTVKVASEVSLSGRSLYSRGPFKNTGPIPPKAEKKTTYTLVLDLGNTQNDVSGARLTGTLGPNVEWTGQTSPTTENLTYASSTRIVTWNPGTLASGAGFSGPGREVSFQVALSPSLGQIGSTPVLLQNITFLGVDTFTGLKINLTIPALTTRISTDPKYVQGDETVVK